MLAEGSSVLPDICSAFKNLYPFWRYFGNCFWNFCLLIRSAFVQNFSASIPRSSSETTSGKFFRDPFRNLFKKISEISGIPYGVPHGCSQEISFTIFSETPSDIPAGSFHWNYFHNPSSFTLKYTRNVSRCILVSTFRFLPWNCFKDILANCFRDFWPLKKNSKKLSKIFSSRNSSEDYFRHFFRIFGIFSSYFFQKFQ